MYTISKFTDKSNNKIQYPYLWFDIAMNNILMMQVPYTRHNLSKNIPQSHIREGCKYSRTSWGARTVTVRTYIAQGTGGLPVFKYVYEIAFFHVF